VSFPFICLIVSGGHTLIVEVKDHGQYKTLGRTRDDAAGEAFDKVARFLNLGFPGGPIIDKLAKEGDPHAVEFKRPMLARRSSKSEGGMEKEFGYDFSFSGIKTAVVNYVQRSAIRAALVPRKIEGQPINDICASFQQAVVETLVEKTIKAALNHKVKTIALAGGVSANSALRKHLSERGKGEGLAVLIPPLEYTTDNAAMIACAAFYKKTPTPLDLKPVASLRL
jgi:N6-L-threonylcarbamoyladenine synthase